MKSNNRKNVWLFLMTFWSSEGFDELSQVFSGVNTKIILTTHKANVAGYQNCFILQRNLLNEVESWELFARKAFPKAAAKDFEDYPMMEKL
ncbi:unnamed protein product [Camellia sinensis]